MGGCIAIVVAGVADVLIDAAAMLPPMPGMLLLQNIACCVVVARDLR